MSTTTETTSEMRDLARALLEARSELVRATEEAHAYAAAASHVSIELRAEISAELATAQAREAAASAALRGAADGSTAARQRAKAEKEAAKAAEAAWQAADARGQLATLTTRQHAMAVRQLGGRFDAMGAARGFGANVASGMASLATTAPMAIGAVAGVVGTLAHASAEAARHERALRVLGSAYQDVSRETLGMVSAEDAVRAQQVMVQSGLQVTGQQLGTVTRAAREYALTTGVELSQALEQLSEGLSEGSNDQLRKYRIQLDRTLPRQEQFAQAVSGLTERLRATRPTAAQADESVAAFGRALTEAGSATGAYVAGGLNNLLSGLLRVPNAGAAALAALRDFANELRTADSAAVDNANSNRALERIRENRRQYEIEFRAFNSSSLLQGSGIRLPSAQELTGPQREAMVTLFKESEHLSSADFQRRARDILALREMEQASSASRRDLAELERRAAAVGAADRRAHARDDLGMLRAQAERLGLAVNLRQQAVTPQQRLNFLQREMGRLLADEEGNREAIRAALQETIQIRESERSAAAASAESAHELRRATEELAMEQRRAFANEVPFIRIQREAGESRLEFLRRALELQRQNNDEAVEAREAQDLAEAEFRRDSGTRAREARKALDEQRAVAEIAARDRALIKAAERRQEAEDFRQRSSLDVQLSEQFGLSAIAQQTAAERSAEKIKMLGGAMSEMGTGAAQAMFAAANSGEDVGAALAKYIDEWAGAKAIQWGMQSLEALALAGVAAVTTPPAVPGLLVSAATFAGLAAGAGIATAAIPNAPSGGAGGAAGGGRGTPKGERLASTGGSSPGTQGGQATYVININSLTAAGPETSAAISRAIDQGTRYGVSPRPTRPIPRSI